MHHQFSDCTQQRSDDYAMCPAIIPNLFFKTITYNFVHRCVDLIGRSLSKAVERLFGRGQRTVEGTNQLTEILPLFP